LSLTTGSSPELTRGPCLHTCPPQQALATHMPVPWSRMQVPKWTLLVCAPSAPLSEIPPSILSPPLPSEYSWGALLHDRLGSPLLKLRFSRAVAPGSWEAADLETSRVFWQVPYSPSSAAGPQEPAELAQDFLGHLDNTLVSSQSPLCAHRGNAFLAAPGWCLWEGSPSKWPAQWLGCYCVPQDTGLCSVLHHALPLQGILGREFART
jgi:hypothetical protein